MPAGIGQGAFDKPLPPYIEFRMEPVEKRDAAGNSHYIDVAYAYITAPGGKDTVVKVADEWFPQIKLAAKNGQYPQIWYNEFFAMYEAWKKGEEVPVSGTHIKNWPSASPAEVKMLLDLKILTVEQVAQMNDQAVNAIGMGGRGLKQRAIDFLQAQTDIGPLVAKMAAFEQELARLKLESSKKDGTIAALESQLQARGAAPAQYQPPQLRPLESRLAEAQAAVESGLPKDSDLVTDAVNEELG